MIMYENHDSPTGRPPTSNWLEKMLCQFYQCYSGIAEGISLKTEKVISNLELKTFGPLLSENDESEDAGR